jgi:hypothetical protein
LLHNHFFERVFISACPPGDEASARADQASSEEPPAAARA